jgi:hypothetical protein
MTASLAQPEAGAIEGSLQGRIDLEQPVSSHRPQDAEDAVRLDHQPQLGPCIRRLAASQQ